MRFNYFNTRMRFNRQNSLFENYPPGDGDKVVKVPVNFNQDLMLKDHNNNVDIDDYKPVSFDEMDTTYIGFKSMYREPKFALCIINFTVSAGKYEIEVKSRSNFCNSTLQTLQEIGYERALKMLPPKRLIKVELGLLDEEMQVEYQTNGVRFKVDSNTNFTEIIQTLADQTCPNTKNLKLVTLKLYGGQYGLLPDVFNFAPPDSTDDENMDQTEL